MLHFKNNKLHVVIRKKKKKRKKKRKTKQNKTKAVLVVNSVVGASS